MKHFITILILGLSFILASCSKKPPKPYVFKPDSEATNIGNSTKTPNYIFTSGFVYHEWAGQPPIFWSEVPFYYRNEDININFWGIQYSLSPWYRLKKLVTSKYFNIWVDISEGAGVFKDATNMTDVAYDKLIRELEKHY